MAENKSEEHVNAPIEESGLEQQSTSPSIDYFNLPSVGSTEEVASDDTNDGHDHTPTPGRMSPGSSVAGSDHTPRSEIPSVAPSPAPWNIVSSSLKPQTSVTELEYFSLQPLSRSRSSNLAIPALTDNVQADANSSSRPRPEFEIVTHAGSHARLSPTLEAVDRPSIHRDMSSASNASTATVRASHAHLDHGSQYTPREPPHYPNQSYSALHSQYHPATYGPAPIRTRGHHLGNYPSYSASQVATLGRFVTQEQYPDLSSRTVGNTPATSPGLYTPPTPPLQKTEDGMHYPSPYLHHMHRQVPRETHVADVTRDSISGRKMINDYEVLDELGRGVHGKVKLGRNLRTNQAIAIKILERNAKRARLGKTDNHEEKIRREIAILKKVRHPHVVSLLEVIDDPKAKKVYLVLELVELGEVKWRVDGAPEIALVEYRRIEREAQGIFHDEAAEIEDRLILDRARKRRERLASMKIEGLANQRENASAGEHWSIEHGGDSDDEGQPPRQRTTKGTGCDENVSGGLRSNPVSNTSLSSIAFTPPDVEADILEGTMYGGYQPEITRGRTPSATGSSGAESLSDEDLYAFRSLPDSYQHVPVMTLTAARSAIRDTVLGLSYLHYQGVIHRDIKPANLLQTRDHRIKISDFGVSYLGKIPRADGEGYESESDAPDDDGPNFDNPLDLAKTVGTPAFFAPELCANDFDGSQVPVTQAIDLWALGVTLYCLVFGRVPFYLESVNKWAILQVIAREDVYIPRYRLKPVDHRSNSRPSSHGRNTRVPIVPTSHTRAPHDLEYELIDDDLYDLLKRLLTKDPRKRITLPEVKRHPWLLRDIPDAVAWVDETEPERQQKGKRIELTHDDLKGAVIPINAFERLGSVVKKTISSVGSIIGNSLGRTGSSRRRAKSSANSEGGPPSTRSSSSTISQDARRYHEERRPSLRVDELYTALKQSRESEHPLSQSVTTSPEAVHHAQFFAGHASGSRSNSPQILGPSDRTPIGKLAGSAKLPLHRAQSVMSTTTSIKTIKQSDFLSSGVASSQPVSPAVMGASSTGEPHGSRMHDFISTTRRHLRSIRSREKVHRSRPGHNREHSYDRFMDRGEDAHAGPSIAWTELSAAGHVEQPSLLRGSSPRDHQTYGLGSSPVSNSGAYTDRLHPDSTYNTPSRQSSISSISSRPLDASIHILSRPTTRGSAAGVAQGLEFSEEQIARAKEEQRRRLVQETRTRNGSTSIQGNSDGPKSEQTDVCPPSPDDELYLEQLKAAASEHNGEPSSSIETSPASQAVDPRGLVSSSSEDQLESGLSQSTSDRSVPSVVSASSSLAAESSMEAPVYGMSFLNKGHPYDSEGYAGDHVVESDDDDDDDSDEEFIVMAPKPKKSALAPPRTESIAQAQLNRRSKNQSLSGVSHKSTRSGSGGTLRKVRSHSVPDDDGAKSRDMSSDS